MGNKLVKLYDGSFKQISELELGERLYENDIVLGKITQKLPLFTHNGYSINNIIQHNNEWQLLSDFISNDAIEMESVYYNIVTINGFYYTNEFTIRDYLEAHHTELFNKIGDITILLLNSSLDINLA
jgi:nitric oxide synthase oxygenase domain/subunit